MPALCLREAGSQLKHLKQLVEYITGMDTRIGVPSDHLSGSTKADVKSPMYATSVGLLMNALDKSEREEMEMSSPAPDSEEVNTAESEAAPTEAISKKTSRLRKSFFEKWTAQVYGTFR